MCDTLLRNTVEGKRLAFDRSVTTNEWRMWGPYVSERQWGTVREDYSESGEAWQHFPHDMARSRAYRWGEDGIAGICDRDQVLCFAPAFWNGKDPIIKERLFGLGGDEGNHGEDVKELYYHVDNTPTHSYMKYRYCYPHEFPYEKMVKEPRNAAKERLQPEYELRDTGALREYFDIQIEYAKASQRDIIIKIVATNCADTAANLTVLPTLWFRNTWSWGSSDSPKPNIHNEGSYCVRAASQSTEMFLYACAAEDGSAPGVLFCENETNKERFKWGANAHDRMKDGINNYITRNQHSAAWQNGGTKAAFHYVLKFSGVRGETKGITLRLRSARMQSPFINADEALRERQDEADAFYSALMKRRNVAAEHQKTVRRALAGMLWSKQYYCYNVRQWMDGDPGQVIPPEARKHGRNADWTHFSMEGILLMPDKWEFPWFAAWDLSFHCVTLSQIDPDFAKFQLLLVTDLFVQHRNGQIPAYEWKFSDINPPLEAWSTLHVLENDTAFWGVEDTTFLWSVYHSLLGYYHHWVQRETPSHGYSAGFLGLDNISAVDRSNLHLKGDCWVDQVDAAAWMGFFSLCMLKISLKLPETVLCGSLPRVALPFLLQFEHVCETLHGSDLWNENSKFFFDVLSVPKATLVDPPAECGDRQRIPLQIFSIVGLLPLIAVENFSVRECALLCNSRYSVLNQSAAAAAVGRLKRGGFLVDVAEGGIQLSLVCKTRRLALLERMMKPEEFMGEYGMRSLSAAHFSAPYSIPWRLWNDANGCTIAQLDVVRYVPRDSETGAFGGNSNWRGPVWLPINFLFIEALEKLHAIPDSTVNYHDTATKISRKLISIFALRENQSRPEHGRDALPMEQEEVLFYEYFNPETGVGHGASHQTGWTALVADLLCQPSSPPGPSTSSPSNPHECTTS